MARDTFDFMDENNRDRDRFGDTDSDSIRSNDSVRSNVTELELVIHHGNARAILVSIDGVEARAQWLPKSQIEIHQKPAKVKGTTLQGRDVELNTATIVVPNWLATKKGLV